MILANKTLFDPYYHHKQQNSKETLPIKFKASKCNKLTFYQLTEKHPTYHYQTNLTRYYHELIKPICLTRPVSGYK